MEQTWVNKLGEGALNVVERTAQGFHAIPNRKEGENILKSFPSMHRLLNVVGMVAGFAGVQYVSNIIFACKINGSNCEELPKEKVPAPLRFLHGILGYNPFSDAPRDQWLKVLHQMLPAIGGAAGAMKGSEIFFTSLNGSEKIYNELMERVKSGHNINAVAAERAVAFTQGKAWRTIAGLFAPFASASGLTPLYGLGLNNGFNLSAGGKVAGLPGLDFLRKLAGNSSITGFGPEKGTAHFLDTTARVMRDGKVDEYAKNLVETGLEPLMRLSETDKASMVKEIKDAFNDSVLDGAQPKEVRKLIQTNILEMIDRTDVKEIKHKLAESNGALGWVVKHFPGVPKTLDMIIGHIQPGAASEYIPPGKPLNPNITPGR